MHARISTIEGDPGRIDGAIDLLNATVIATLKGLKGFTAVNFLADRAAGRLVAVAFWQDEEALRGSAEVVDGLRTEIADAIGGKVVGVESYELVAQSW